MFPEHKTYVEPFLGGGSVLLNKPKADREIAGDLDVRLIDSWDVIRRHPATLMNWLSNIDYCEDEFRWYSGTMRNGKPRTEHPDLDIRVVAYIVRNRMSRGALGKTFAKCGTTADGSPRLRGGKPDNVNAWDTIRAEMPAISDRVKDVEFHCCSAVELIREFDGSSTVIYADPPYLHETRTAKQVYDHEMSWADHVALLAALVECRGTFFLSGYRCDLYDAAATLNGWDRADFSVVNHSGQGKTKQKRVESVWSNRPITNKGA